MLSNTYWRSIISAPKKVPIVYQNCTLLRNVNIHSYLPRAWYKTISQKQLNTKSVNSLKFNIINEHYTDLHIHLFQTGGAVFENDGNLPGRADMIPYWHHEGIILITSIWNVNKIQVVIRIPSIRQGVFQGKKTCIILTLNIKTFLYDINSVCG